MAIEVIWGVATFGGTAEEIRRQKYEGGYFEFMGPEELRMAFAEAEQRRVAEMDALSARKTRLDEGISQLRQKIDSQQSAAVSNIASLDV